MNNTRSYRNLSNEQKDLLLTLSQNIAGSRSKEAILDIINNQLGSILHFNAVTVSLLHPNGVNHGAYLYSFPDEMLKHPELSARATEKYVTPDGVYEVLLASEVPVVYDLDELVKQPGVPGYVDFFWKNGIREMVAFPIQINNKTVGGLWIHAKRKNAFTASELEFTGVVASQIAIAIANIQAYEKIESQLAEINSYKLKLEEENVHLQEKLIALQADNQMIGTSPELKRVFELVANVAFSNTSVLLCGETGTGKELIAKAIHQASPRKNMPLVKVNCAAIPASLMESELFGHEKGSFTGATDRRIGKFELANDGTLFLDEIGELPIELQVKLLRSIQEKEIERIGGTQVIKTNVRIITATNRNLENEVAEGRFRKDLYYRLNVFPIMLPALRERKEDIPLLAAHFMNQVSKKCGKHVTNLSARALKQLTAYDWPGNIRELEHVIERAVLLANGTTITEFDLPSVKKIKPTIDDGDVKTINEVEREYILSVLKKTSGKIHGPGGAAQLLKIPATTLASKLKKLGIKKSHQ